MKKIFIYHLMALFLLALAVEKSTANTNYVAGNISCQSVINTNCWVYLITVNLYTYKDSLPPDTIIVSDGDNTTANISRTDTISVNNNIILSKYKYTHAFPGSGNYTIDYADTLSRISGINIGSTFNRYFVLSTTFTIDPILGCDTSVAFYDYPIMQAKINDTFHYNPIAIPSYNDSMSFELFVVDTMPYYYIPQGLTINPVSGEIIWTNPTVVGSYSFYLLVNEWQYNPNNGIALNTGSVLKYFTINVQDFHSSFQFQNIQSWDTNFYGYYQYTLYPNQNLQLFFSYSDSTADSIKALSNGDIYALNDAPSFSTINSGNQVYGLFNWTPQVSNVRGNPYIACFVGSSYIDTEVINNYVTVLIYVDSLSTSGIKEVANESLQILVYPNPSNTTLNIHLSSLEPNETLLITDVIGEVIHQETLSGIDNSIDVSKWSEGVYFYEIIQNNSIAPESARGKFVKQ